MGGGGGGREGGAEGRELEFILELDSISIAACVKARKTILHERLVDDDGKARNSTA